MDNFVAVLCPDGLVQSVPLTPPTNAPIEPLYRIPIGLMVSPLKVKLPSTYSSAAGSELIYASARSGRLISNVGKLFWLKIESEG